MRLQISQAAVIVAIAASSLMAQQDWRVNNLDVAELPFPFVDPVDASNVIFPPGTAIRPSVLVRLRGGPGTNLPTLPAQTFTPNVTGDSGDSAPDSGPVFLKAFMLGESNDGHVYLFSTPYTGTATDLIAGTFDETGLIGRSASVENGTFQFDPPLRLPALDEEVYAYLTAPSDAAFFATIDYDPTRTPMDAPFTCPASADPNVFGDCLDAYSGGTALAARTPNALNSDVWADPTTSPIFDVADYAFEAVLTNVPEPSSCIVAMAGVAATLILARAPGFSRRKEGILVA